MKITFNLFMRPHAKKNSRKMWMRDGRFFSAPSDHFIKFQQLAIYEINKKLASLGIKKRPVFYKNVSVITIFSIPGKEIIDADNMHTSVLDILQEAKVISNDRFVIEGAYGKVFDCGSWMITITIDDYEQN